MKNIQIIDGAENCVYDIFAVSDTNYMRLFPNGTDIAFIDEIYEENSLQREELDNIFSGMWKNRIKKSEVHGIHGIIFYELERKKKYYPTRRDEEAINPNGSALR